MTTPQDHNPGRGDVPTVGEIAALTARLRDLTTPGRDVDPAERAAVLADKAALLDRIAESETRTRHRHAARVPAADDAARRMIAMGYGPPVQLTGDPLDASAADVPSQAVRVESAQVEPARVEAVQVEPVQVEMPGWMREHAARTETGWGAAGPPVGPAHRDDPQVLAARVAALREQIAQRDATAPTDGADRQGLIGPTPYGTLVDPEQEARREQLTRWHHADTTTHGASTDGAAAEVGGERRAIWDDEPGQP